MSALDAACVVIPTRNEAENIGKLLEALRAQSPSVRLVVVDDDSPDGTAAQAEKAGARVIRRVGKRGRGSAVLEGFAAALADPGVKLVVEMDADFSHAPDELPALAALIAEGKADMAVGSRYAEGSVIIGWPVSRRVFSRCANAAARALLGLPLSDCTNGFRAYSRRAVEALSPVENPGFFALSEIACQLQRKGMSFAERPSVFVNRKRGVSNLSLAEIASAFVGLLRLASR